MNQKTKIWKQRKIIHIDMDSFFASIEIRDNPNLQNKPVAVGGKANERGVLTTCNYLARKYGLHSAMSSKTAIQLCKDLIILPVNIAKYRKLSKEIFSLPLYPELKEYEVKKICLALIKILKKIN